MQSGIRSVWGQAHAFALAAEERVRETAQAERKTHRQSEQPDMQSPLSEH